MIIQVNSIGLGDHLFYSHIPEIVSMKEKVYISNHSTFINQDYKKVIWDNNPYVAGYTDEVAPIVPDISKLRDCRNPNSFNENENILDIYLNAYGFDDGVKMHNPRIYGIEKTQETNLKIFDPNSKSHWVLSNLTIEKVIEFLNRTDNFPDYQVYNYTGGLSLPNVPVLPKLNFYEYLEIVNTCKKFVGYWSGGINLRAALGKTADVIYSTPWPFFPDVFKVKNNRYHNLGE